MRRTVKQARTALKLLLICALSALLVVFRYILRTPQPFDSMLPGEARLYKWRYGHIYYKVAGPADAPPLVLFHSLTLGASGNEMRYLAERLAQDYRVYAPDLLGFGLSDHPQIDYTADLYIALYRDFLRDIVQQPAVLLASGLSNHYCIAVANAAPALCRRVILIAPATVFALPKRPAWLTLLASNKLTGFILYAGITARPLLYIIVNRRHNLEKAYPGFDELHTLFAAAHQFGAQYAILALLAGRLDLEVTHLLLYLAPPVQIIWGERAIQASSRLPSIAPQTRVDMIDDSGTYPHIEQPAKVVAYIQAYEGKKPDALESPSFITIQESLTAAAESAAASMEQLQEQVTVAEGQAAVTDPGTGAMDTAIVQNDDEDVITGQAQAEENETVNEQPDIEAYCFKCKQKRVMQEARRITTKNGRNAMEGSCPVCGTRLFRFVAG